MVSLVFNCFQGLQTFSYVRRSILRSWVWTKTEGGRWPIIPRNSGRPIAGSRFLGTGPLYNRAFWFVYRSATKRTHSWTQTQVIAPRKRIFYLQKTTEEWSKNSLTEYDNQKNSINFSNRVWWPPVYKYVIPVCDISFRKELMSTVKLT